MSNKPLVPEVKEALDKINSENANEIGLSYESKADRPSRLNGYVGGIVGGLMTKKMVEAYEKKLIDK